MSTEEGAQIQFHCDEGYTPSQWNTSQCTNTTWSPDPLLLHCMSELSGPQGNENVNNEFRHDDCNQCLSTYVLSHLHDTQ